LAKLKLKLSTESAFCKELKISGFLLLAYPFGLPKELNLQINVISYYISLYGYKNEKGVKKPKSYIF